MSRIPFLSRTQFETLVAEHQELIGLVNELELQIYRLGDPLPVSEPCVADCQRAAGHLIGRLRRSLFHQDQLVLPILESLISPL